MPELVICRGLQASGKTTRARAWVAEDAPRRARVNRDDFRQMLHDGVWINEEMERKVMAAQNAAISSLLGDGISVVCDDTNLLQWVAEGVALVGRLAGIDVVVWDMTDVPLETCLERDAAREESVGEERIRATHARYLAGGSGVLAL